MGFAKRADNTPLDTATVTITNLDTNNTRNTTTDGEGFYGGVDLTPGNYIVKAVLNNETLYSCVANVAAGRVTTANLQANKLRRQLQQCLIGLKQIENLSDEYK